MAMMFRGDQPLGAGVVRRLDERLELVELIDVAERVLGVTRPEMLRPAARPGFAQLGIS